MKKEIISNILVVVDVQNDFVYGKFSNKEVKKIVPRIKAEILSNTIKYNKVIFTQDQHDKRDFLFDGTSTYEGRLFDQHCLWSSAGGNIVFELADLLQRDEVRSLRKNNFDGSSLIHKYIEETTDMVEDVNIKYNYYIAGCSTDICVLATAIGFTKYKDTNKITVVSGLCAGTSPKAHKTALAAMKSFGIKVKNLYEFHNEGV